MGLLDQLKSRDDGVSGAGSDGTAGGVPSWRPAKERKHPEAIEGVIAEVGSVRKREPKEGGPTHDTVVVIYCGDNEAWKVYGSVRDLHDKFSALEADGLLVPGTKIALKFFGERKEVAKDGTPYSVHSYAVAAEKGDGNVPKNVGAGADGSPIWEMAEPPF